MNKNIILSNFMSFNLNGKKGNNKNFFIKFINFKNLIKQVYYLRELLKIQKVHIEILNEKIDYLEKDLQFIAPQICKIYKDNGMNEECIAEKLHMNINEIKKFM